MITVSHRLMSTLLISGCAIIDNKQILLIKKKERDFWELPGGIMNAASSGEQEAVEHTFRQISIKPELIQQFTVLEFQKNGQNTEATIFECSINDDDKPIPGEGIKEVKWLPIETLSKETIGEDVKSILEEI